jgi:hypothetical protein
MPQSHSHSPFQDGFAAVWHEPALLAAELTWRWCFGLSAWILATAFAALFLDGIQISSRDELLLGTLQPKLLQEAVRHIFHGTLTRLVLEQAILLLGLMLLWSLAATAGRAATLRRLVAMFSDEEEPDIVLWHFGPVFVLNLLRVMWSVIALSAMLISLVAGIIMANRQRAFMAVFFMTFGIGLAWVFGVMLNWYFGLAPLFCIRNRVGAAEALAQSVDFSSRQAGRLFGLGAGFRALRLVWAGTMFFAVLAPLPLMRHIARGWVGLIMAIVALIYFAGADLLYLARLAAYVSLAEDDSHPAETPEPTIPAEPLPPPNLAPSLEPA